MNMAKDTISVATRSPSRDGPLHDAFALLIGKIAWGAKKGHGSFLTFEFGEPHIVIHEPPGLSTATPASPPEARRRLAFAQGEHHLWIYMCNWRVRIGDEVIADNESADARMEAAARALNGQKLVAVEVDPARGTSVFRFDLFGSLETWPDEGSADEQWSVIGLSETFIFRGDGTWMRVATDATPQEPDRKSHSAGSARFTRP
jgi:hypothetical protein